MYQDDPFPVALGARQRSIPINLTSQQRDLGPCYIPDRISDSGQVSDSVQPKESSPCGARVQCHDLGRSGPQGQPNDPVQLTLWEGAGLGDAPTLASCVPLPNAILLSGPSALGVGYQPSAHHPSSRLTSPDPSPAAQAIHPKHLAREDGQGVETAWRVIAGGLQDDLRPHLAAWINRVFDLVAVVNRGLTSRDQLVSHISPRSLALVEHSGVTGWKTVMVQWHGRRGTFVAMAPGDPPTCVGVIKRPGGRFWIDEVALMPTRRTTLVTQPVPKVDRRSIAMTA